MTSMDRECDASQVLAAALEQMDGIISSATLGIAADENCNGHSGVDKLLAELRQAVEWSHSAGDGSVHGVDPATAKFVHAWLDQVIKAMPNGMTPVSGDYGDLQDKMSHLEAEKENLALQVSVLSDQLELQKDKIAELESSLLDKKLLLERTEQLLKQEMTLKKKIENDRLELLSDVPALKLKLVTAEREKSELESKVKKLETDVVLLRSHLAEREAELITRCGRVPASPHHGSVSSVADSFRATPTKLGADWKERSPAPGDSDRQALPSEGYLQEKPPKCPLAHDDGSHSLSNVRQYSNSLPRSHNQQVRRSGEAAAAAAPAPAASSKDVFRSRKSSTGVSFAQPELVVARSGCPLYSPPSAASTLKHSKSRGLKKIFGRLRRSNSHTMDVSDSFQRGGLRATAGPRLGWTPVTMQNNHCFTDKPVTSELEKELGMRHPLHRKKLLLAVDCLRPEASDLSRAAAALDAAWVLRWLDDVGLPQYKDAFAEALVDGAMLNALTVDDLLRLKVSNHFHHLSMKRGIQVLRLNRFNPSCLKRRSLPDEQQAMAIDHAGVQMVPSDELNRPKQHQQLESIKTTKRRLELVAKSRRSYNGA
ncbi:hypothetical protein MRX96_038483 [Rhipicephalus microplus]